MKHLIAIFTAAWALSACQPPHTAAAPQGETPMHAEQPAYPQLLDEARQLYRFKDGICRELGKLPAPWKLVDDKPYRQPGPWGPFPPGYVWIPTSAMGEERLLLMADNADLGVAPPNTVPGEVKRRGWKQDVTTLYIGAPGWGLTGSAHIAITNILNRSNELNGRAWRYLESPIDIPIAEGFEFYADNKDYIGPNSSVYIVNHKLKAGLDFVPGMRNFPNGYYQGLLLLGNGEEAQINLSIEALEKLDVILESMINAARAIRVECPAATGETP